MKLVISLKGILITLVLLLITNVNNNFAQESLTIDKHISGINISILHKQIVNSNDYTLRDTIYSFPTPNGWPSGLAWDGEYFWINALDSLLSPCKIYKVDTMGRVLKSFSMPDALFGGGLEWDGSNLWLADEQSAKLFKIDTTTGISLEQYNLPSFGFYDPNGFGLAWDGEYLWHSQYGDSSMIFKLDPLNGQIINSFIPPKSSILGITYANNCLCGVNLEPVIDDSTWEVTEWNSTIYKMDPNNGTVLDSADWDVPYPVGLVWDGTNFWNISSSTLFGGNERVYQVQDNIVLGIVENNRFYPNYFSLSQNYPNPFNPTTTIQYDIPKTSQVTLTIYNMNGQVVERLVNQKQEPEFYSVLWDAKNVSTGMYFYCIQADGFSTVKKCLLIK